MGSTSAPQRGGGNASTKSSQGTQTSAAPESIQTQINHAKGSGYPMDKQTLSFMGNRFRTDFNNVRVHNDSISSDSGLTGMTGFIEYRRNFLQLKIEGSMTGLGESTGITPGGDMRIQGTLTIPLW